MASYSHFAHYIGRKDTRTYVVPLVNAKTPYEIQP